MKIEISKTFGVYQIKNLVDRKIYIGSTHRTFSTRWASWRNDLNKGKGNEHLSRAWNKYGSENFEFSVIEVLKSKEDVIIREQYWIDVLKPEYNFMKKAGAHRRGTKSSEETRKKLSDAGIKRYSSKEERQAQSDRVKASWDSGRNTGMIGKTPHNKGIRQERLCPHCSKPVKEYYTKDGKFSVYGKTCGAKECWKLAHKSMWDKQKGGISCNKGIKKEVC